MSGIDYEELIRSPLDDLNSDEEKTGWLQVVAGLVVGIGAGLLLISVFGGSTANVEAPPVVETATTAAVVELVSPDYPEGFTELVPGIGATVSEIVRTDEAIAVVFLLAVARGGDALARDWPVGGTWLLESSSGTVAQSTRVVVGRFRAAAFTVEFPAAAFSGERAFSTVSTVELWNQVTVSGSVEQPFSGEPWVAEPVSIPISTESTLILANVELGRSLGLVEWQLEGPEPGGMVDVAAQLLDSAGVEIGSYASFPSHIAPGPKGSKELNWDQPFRVDQRGATSVVLDYTVSTVDVEAADVSFDLSSVSSG